MESMADHGACSTKLILWPGSTIDIFPLGW
jgi:hypothetical protein